MTGESVEQAARVAGWRARARREAAAILAETDTPYGVKFDRNDLVTLLSIAWIQGCNFGMHDTLALVDESFEKMRAEA